MQGRFLYILLYVILGLPSVAQAQRTVHLDDVQVMASRRLKDVGVEMTKLDTLVLHDNVSLSMADILQKNSTVFVKSYGRATESLVEFRGTSPSHTQVTWNGMRINSPMLGTLDFSTIPAYFIDEANLYHGASSINLLGGGLGGAVEMVNRPVHKQGWGVQLVQGIGSFDTYDDFARLTYRNSRFSSSTRVGWSKADNDYPYTNYDKKVDVRDASGKKIGSYHPEERNKSGYFDDLNLLQELYSTLSDADKMEASVWYTHSKRGLPFLSVDYKDDADFHNEQMANTLRGVLSWTHATDPLTIAAKAGYSYSDVGYEYYTTRQTMTNSITSSRSYSNTAFLQASADWHVTQRLLLMGGADFYYNHVNSHDRSPFHTGENFNLGRPEYHANLQARWRPVDVFSVAAVVRQEVYKNDWVAPIPALFADLILCRPLNLVLKASVARNYRYPSMDDLYFQPGGNPNLRPEKGFTYDAGIEMGVQRKSWTLCGNLTAFDSHISDWILWTPNLKGFWEPSNVKKVHNYGLEASLDGSLLLPLTSHSTPLKITLGGNFAWTPSKNVGEPVNANDDSYGKQLPYVPVVSANAHLRVQWRSWTLAGLWTHYSERFTTTSNEVSHITGRLKPYYMTDLSLEKTFLWGQTQWSLKGVVNNLFSTEYVTVLSRPMPRRNYEIYLTFKL